jgi:hypothetical protein
MFGTVRFSVAMIAAALTAACSTAAAPVGPYPVGRAPHYPGGPVDMSPRILPAPATQCVPYARSLSGIEIWGDAHTWWARAEGRYAKGPAPAVGSVIVIRTFDDGSRGHVAVVTRVLSGRVILVDHANWHGRGEVAVQVPIRDVSRDNSWSQVNVWWLDTNRWGAKSYLVEGFIYPR